MALQPSNRPNGSSHVLRFSGAVQPGVPIAAFPKQNGEYSTDVATIGGVPYYEIRLELADVTNLSDEQKRLPAGTYDDSQLAGVSPHPATPGLGVNVDGLNVTEQNISARTWAQNTYVTVQSLDAATATVVKAINPVLTKAVLDGTASGLGRGTGLPVLVLFAALQLPQQPGPLNLDILVEIRHTPNR